MNAGTRGCILVTTTQQLNSWSLGRTALPLSKGLHECRHQRVHIGGHNPAPQFLVTVLHYPVSEQEFAWMQALEAALERQPKDGDLAAQIGAALVSTHQYRRALDYYHKAVRNSPANQPLQLHLARLLLRLRSWDSAEKVKVSLCVLSFKFISCTYGA